MSMGTTLGTFLHQVGDWLTGLDLPVLRPTDIGHTVAPLDEAGLVPAQYLPPLPPLPAAEPRLPTPPRLGMALTSDLEDHRGWIDFPTGGGSPPPAPAGGTGIGPVIAVVSDSTGQNFAGNGSWPFWMGTLLPARPLVLNFSVGGRTSADMRAVFADVLAAHPDRVILEAGVNDAGQSRTFPACRDDIQAMAEMALAAGVVPILATVPYANDWLPELNAWIRAYSAQQRLLYIPFAEQLCLTDGSQPPGYLLLPSPHQTLRGAKAWGVVAAAALTPWCTPGAAPLAQWNNDPGNLLGNPLFVTADPANPDTPAGWSKLITASDHTCSLIPDATDLLGVRQLWRIEIAHSAHNGMYGVELHNLIAGHTYEMCGRVSKTLIEGNECEWWIGVDLPASAQYNVVQELANVRESTGDVVFRARLVLPAAAVGHAVVYLAGGAGDGRTAYTLSQWTFRDLTALGLG